MSSSQGTGKTTLSWADILLLVTAVLWGVNFSVVKFALAEIPPLAFNGIRFLVASATMLVLTFATGKQARFRRRDLPYLIGLGLLGNTAYQLFFVFGIASTAADNSSLILATSPVWIALIGTAFGVERVERKGWLGIALSLFGIALIVLGSDQAAHFEMGGPSLKGDGLVLIGTVCWACYTLLVRPLTRRYSSTAITSFSTSVGAIPLALLAIPSWRALDWGAVGAASWVATVASGFFSIGVAYFFWNYGVARLGGTRTSIYSNLSLPVALVTAWLWLGESLTVLQWFGAFLVLSGVVLARRFARAIDR